MHEESRNDINTISGVCCGLCSTCIDNETLEFRMRFEAQCWVFARQDEMPDQYTVFTVNAENEQEARVLAKQREKRAYEITIVPMETV
jgi:hypothetical protein